MGEYVIGDVTVLFSEEVELSLAVLMSGPDAVERYGDGSLVEQILRGHHFGTGVSPANGDNGWDEMVFGDLDDKWHSETDAAAAADGTVTDAQVRALALLPLSDYQHLNP